MQHRSHLNNWPRSRVGDNHLLTKTHSSIYIARLTEDTQAHQALQCHIDCLSDVPLTETGDVLQSPDHPRNRWLDQFHMDNNAPSADL